MPLTDQDIAALDTIYPDGLYCHQCGERDIIYESDAEDYWCPECGASDADE